MPNGFFARHIIQEYNFCQLSQLFIVSVSLASGFLKERDKIFSTYSGPSYLPDFLTDSSWALKPWPICALPQGYYTNVQVFLIYSFSISTRTYQKFANAVPIYTIFGLCTRKLWISALVFRTVPLKQIFFKPKISLMRGHCTLKLRVLTCIKQPFANQKKCKFMLYLSSLFSSSFTSQFHNFAFNSICYYQNSSLNNNSNNRILSFELPFHNTGRPRDTLSLAPEKNQCSAKLCFMGLQLCTKVIFFQKIV